MNEARLIVFREPVRAHQLLARGLAKAPDLAIVQRTRAYIAIIDGDTDRALAAAEKAVELDPDDVANWVELGTVHQARIRERQLRHQPPDDEIFEAAIEALKRVEERLGAFPRARLEIARLYAVWPGHRMHATKTYEKALALAKEQGSPFEIGFAARAMHQYAQQIGNYKLRKRALRTLVEVDDSDYAAWDDLARIADAMPRGSAEEVYLRLLGKRPEDPRAHLLYVSFLIRSGRSDDAEAHLRRRLEDGLEDPLLWERLLLMKIQAGRMADARALYVEMADGFPEAFPTRVAEARLTLAEGRSDAASRQLRVLVAERETFELQRLLALAEYRLGDLAEARKAIERSLELAPTPHFPVIRLKALIDYASGNWKASLEAYRVLIERKQELSEEERVRIATALDRIGKRAESREVLERMLAAETPSAEAVIAYAELEGENDPERAHAQLVAAHERVPADPRLLETLTELEVRSERATEALARLDRVVAARLASASTLLVRAELLAGMGAYERAEADVLRAFEADPTLPGAINLLFTIYRMQGKLEEARRSFEQAEEAGVLHSGARLLLGRLYLSDGDTARAREMLERVVREHPELWTAKNDLAYVLAERREDLDRAVQLAREAHTASGRNATTADTVGYAHLAAGRPEAALQQFQRAIRLAQQRSEPLDPSFQYHVGLALRAMGRDDEAAQAFEKALGDGDFPDAEEARRQLEAARHPEAEPGSSS
jgi:tetratricopeptide (TPR) repeat protein